MPADAGALAVYCLDVGQGDCTFIVPPEGDPILFDCADAYVAARFVANHRISRLEAVVASHMDADHIRGLLPFLRNHLEEGGEVGRLVIGLDRQVRRGQNKALRALIEQALRWAESPPHDGFTLAPPFRLQDAAMTLAQGADWSVELVLPMYHQLVGRLLRTTPDANRCSAVLRVERGGSAILIGGDAPLGSWEDLEDTRRAADGIRTPHHGGRIDDHTRTWTTCDELYTAIGAKLAVVSVGSNNRYGHPPRAPPRCAQGRRVPAALHPADAALSPRSTSAPRHRRGPPARQRSGVALPPPARRRRARGQRARGAVALSNPRDPLRRQRGDVAPRRRQHGGRATSARDASAAPPPSRAATVHLNRSTTPSRQPPSASTHERCRFSAISRVSTSSRRSSGHR